MKTILISFLGVAFSFTAAASVTECPRLLSLDHQGKQVVWTKDILVPHFNTISLDYQINGEMMEDGFFSYKKAERACAEVTKACAGSSLHFRVPTIAEWKVLIKKGLFNELNHPTGSGRGYWASDKSMGAIAFGPIPAYGSKRGLISLSGKEISSLDAGALMAAKCIAVK